MLVRWDLKTAIAAAFRRAHPDFVPFGRFVEDCAELVRPFDVPDKVWPVYGVSNQSGVFLSHRQPGKSFNAPYKRIRKDWFFHNPTRANVGSIGRVPAVEDEAITSPEYQVWCIKDPNWSPEFVELLVQAEFFNRLVQVHRVGAVKERLYTENLMEIPVPNCGPELQHRLVAEWDEARLNAGRLEAESATVEKEAKLRLARALGLHTSKAVATTKAFALPWSEIERWGFDQCRIALAGAAATKWPTRRVAELCKIGSGGTPSRQVRGFFENGNIPWVKTTEVRDGLIESTQESITREALAKSSAKVYPKGSLIVAMYGQGATRGRTARLGVDAATNQACCVLYDFSPLVEPNFLWRFLMVRYEHLRALASGNNQPNLNAEMIANYEVPLPSLEIQRDLSAAFAEAIDLARALRAEAIGIMESARQEVESALLGHPLPESASAPHA